MPAVITTLISTRDNSEIIRDRIADILLLEQAAQQVLARAADPIPLDPNQWKLRVFTERSNPWEEFLAVDCPEDSSPDFAAPIVNVWVDGITYDPRASTGISRQKGTATYNIDCYGYGVTIETAEGQDAGDAKAAIEVQRAVRLVRNILMAGHYVQLGFPNGASAFVWKRWLQSVQMFQPQMDGKAVAHVAGARLSFTVDFNEFSPEYQGEIGEEMVVTIRNAATGEVLFTTQYGESPP